MLGFKAIAAAVAVADEEVAVEETPDAAAPAGAPTAAVVVLEEGTRSEMLPKVLSKERSEAQSE